MAINSNQLEAGSQLEDGRARSLPDWPELASEVVGSLSRILHAELHLIEATIRDIIGDEVDRVLKAMVAFVLIAIGAICAVITVILVLHQVFGMWWPAFAIVAGVMLVGGAVLFVIGPRRPDRARAPT